MKISIVLPTRKHIQKLNKLVMSIISTTNNINNIELCLRIDNDDIESREEIDRLLFDTKLNIKYIVGPRSKNYGIYWNDAFGISSGEIIMMCGDDFVFETIGWDDVVIQKFEDSKDKIILVFGDDGIQHGNIATHAFIHRSWINCLGYYVPMYFNIYYHDTWLTDISERIGRKVYISDLKFTHNHRSIGKDISDSVTTDMDTNAYLDNGIWESTVEIRKQDADKLRKLCYG